VRAVPQRDVLLRRAPRRGRPATWVLVPMMMMMSRVLVDFLWFCSPHLVYGTR